MAVMNREELEEHKRRSGLTDAHCFFCGQEIFSGESSTGVAVVWASTSTVLLHQGCAEMFAVNLIGDARSAATLSGKRVRYRFVPAVADTTWYLSVKPKGD